MGGIGARSALHRQSQRRFEFPAPFPATTIRAALPSSQLQQLGRRIKHTRCLDTAPGVRLLPWCALGLLLHKSLSHRSLPKSEAGIWAALATAACAGLWCERTKWGKEMSGALLR